MLKSIALWLLDFLYGKLDPDAQKRIDEYRAKAKQLEEDERRAKEEIARLEREAAQAATERQRVHESLRAIYVEIESLGKARERVRDELAKKKSDVAGKSDSDILRSEL